MVDFRIILTDLEYMGVYDVVLPFMLIFTIVFAILEKTMIFGNSGSKEAPHPKTNINAVFALIVSTIVITNQEFIGVIKTYLPGVSLVIVIGIFFMLITAMFSEEGWKGLPFWGGGIIALIAVIWSLSDPIYGAGNTGFGYFYRTLNPYFNLIIVGAIIVIIFFLLIKGSRR